MSFRSIIAMARCDSFHPPQKACYPYETMKETWYLAPGEVLEVKLKFTDHGKNCHLSLRWSAVVRECGDAWIPK